jgi:hypothetical protein
MLLRPERDLPLILTAAFPGLGHWKCGRKRIGGLCICLSLLLVSLFLVNASVLTPVVIAFARDPLAGPADGFLKLLISLAGLTGYGFVYTGLLIWDIRRDGGRIGGRVPGPAAAAIVSGAAAVAIFGWLTWAGIHGL